MLGCQERHLQIEWAGAEMQDGEAFMVLSLSRAKGLRLPLD
jgi:hypothetical protein